MDQDQDGIIGESPDDLFKVAIHQAPNLVIDDGDAGFSLTSGWALPYNGAGYQDDFRYKSVGNGAETADWTFTGLAPGEYRVWVTWDEYTNRAVDTPYTVLDSGTPLATIAVNQQLAPAELIEGHLWQDLGGIYQISGDTLVVQLSDLATPAGNYVIADAVRIEHLPAEPEIEVHSSGSNLVDGTGLVDFGNAITGTPVTQTFTVKNVGTLDLTLGTITVPAGFSLQSDFGVTPLPSGQTTDFTLQLDALAAGSYAGVVSFDSNDLDENPFEFDVTGTVLDTPPPIQVIDDGDAGFSRTSGWELPLSLIHISEPTRRH